MNIFNADKLEPQVTFCPKAKLLHSAVEELMDSSSVRLNVYIAIWLGSQQQASEGDTRSDPELGDRELQVLGYCIRENFGA